MSGFQTQVNVQPAPAVEGDWSTANPRVQANAGPGGFVAGPNGVIIGRFVWGTPPLDPENAPIVVNNFGSGLPIGIVHREMQAMLTAYLQAAGMTIPQGFPVIAHSECDIWVKNNGTTQALIGQKAYASYANGSISFAATGSPTTGGTGTASTIAAETASFTGSVSGNVLTVTAVASGTLVEGGIISGGSVVSGTQIVEQVTGTTGGVGTYYVTPPEQTSASASLSETYGLLTVGGTVTGTFSPGGIVSGSGVTTGTVITANGTGTGGAGTYIVSPTQTVGSESISQTANIETKFYAMSAGAAGELVKISSWPLG